MRDMRIRGYASVTWALVAAAASVGCTDGGLAAMKNKELMLTGAPGDGGFVYVSLLADGCPLLDGDSVTATLNGHAMDVDPGHHGSGPFEGPCYQPMFSLSPLPADLGDTLTITIGDASETLQMVVSDYHPVMPALDPVAFGTANRGETLLVPYHAPADAALVARAVLGTDPSSSSDPPPSDLPCAFYPDATAVLQQGHVQITVPSDICPGTATLFLTVKYSREAYLSSCHGATCSMDDFTTSGNAMYGMSIAP
jgi:hypothetical protein